MDKEILCDNISDMARTMPRAVANYIRFAIKSVDPSSGVPQGLFQVSAAVRESPETPDYDYERLGLITQWFNENLAAPDRFDRNLARRYSSFKNRGISWFKASATEHISMMREMAAILSEHGYFIDQIETDRPGYVVYEDQHQIVAEPFADTPTSQ